MAVYGILRILPKYQIAYPINEMLRRCGELGMLMLIQLADPHIPSRLSGPVLVGLHSLIWCRAPKPVPCEEAKHARMLCSLPASAFDLLREILEPESEDNPFLRVQTRWRGYVGFILMLYQQ